MLPVLFISHGSPMLALEPGPWGRSLAAWGASLPTPRAILVASAHWETPVAFQVSASPAPATLHDFAGFPDVLYRLSYPAPGSPEIALEVTACLRQAGFDTGLDTMRPLDHGAWVPIRTMFPGAEVPVLQVSLPRIRNARHLYEAGRALRPLREEGVLIVASGGLVHNLHRLDWRNGQTDSWASTFESWVLDRVLAGSPEALQDLMDRHKEAPHRAEAVPTTEHFDPLFLALGAAGQDRPQAIHRGWQLGSLSLACLAWGERSNPA